MDASNGAIIITTKKGSAGKAKVSYNNLFGWDMAYGIRTNNRSIPTELMEPQTIIIQAGTVDFTQLE